MIETDFCDVPLDEVLDTELFSLERAETNPLWFKELNGLKDHVPETEEYRIGSFVLQGATAVQPRAPRQVREYFLARRRPRQGLLLAGDAAALCGRTQSGGRPRAYRSPRLLVGGGAADPVAG